MDPVGDNAEDKGCTASSIARADGAEDSCGEAACCGEETGEARTKGKIRPECAEVPMKRKFSLGERIVGVGMITQAKVFKNREKKVYGRVFGNKN